MKDILFPAWGTLLHLCSCSLSLCIFQRRRSKASSYSAEAFQSLSHYLCNFCYGLSCVSPLNFKFQHLSGKKVNFQVTCCQYFSDKAEFKRGTFETSLLIKNLKSRSSSCTGICRVHHHQNGQLGKVLLNHLILVLKAQWTWQCQTQHRRTSQPEVYFASLYFVVVEIRMKI